MNHKMGVQKVKKLTLAILIVVAVAMAFGAVISVKILNVNQSDLHSLQSVLKGNAIGFIACQKKR